MIEPKFISDEENPNESLNLDYLIEKGIKLISQYSGKEWSDYNYHDPGITLLEQICYAITDLAYRTNLPLENLLYNKGSKVDLEKDNMLHPPSKILPSSPLSAKDFRKLIITHTDQIKNAWVLPIIDNKFGFQGLYEVAVQCNEEINTTKEESIKSQIRELLMNHRSLGTDFHEIKILSSEMLSIDAKIHIDSFVLGESILAKIYHEIEKMINPKVQFFDEAEMLERNHDLSNLYAGPDQKTGFIEVDQLTSKTNEIYVSELKELIESIEGVIEILSFNVFKNGIKIFEDLVSFGRNSYPILEKNIIDYHEATDKIVFLRNNNHYEVDTVILSQLYDSLNLSSEFRPNNVGIIKKKKPPARFEKNEIEEYFSIQKELPGIYGLRSNELPTNSPKRRRAQAKQLKAFLTLFEQIMADHLSQVANIKNIFSIDSNIETTFFKQYPTDIPEIESVLIPPTQEDYLAIIKQFSEQPETFFKRRNSVLDHLLSRFGEFYENSILIKLWQSLLEDKSANEIQLNSIKSKINYARNVITLGRERIKAFNYNLDSWDTDNCSGIEKRLKLIFDISESKTKSLTSPLLDFYTNDSEEIVWSKGNLKLEDNSTLSVHSIDRDYGNDAYFHLQNENEFNNIFLFGHKAKSFLVVASKKRKKVVYNLLYNTPNQELPTKIYEGLTREDCIAKRNNLINQFQNLNIQCEGFYLLEHILLRPLIPTNYTTRFFDDSGEELLISFASSDFESQQDQREDIFILGTNEENYVIETNKSKAKQYKIVVYDILNKPIFKSAKIYYSKPIIKKEINRMISYFMEKRANKVELDTFSSIKIEDGNSHEFPSDFKYSNHVSFIFPNWPFRIQNSEFLSFIKEKIEYYIPAHLSYEIFLLDFRKLSLFEDLYLNWLQAKKNEDFEKLDLLSLQLIQLLSSYKPLS